MTDSEAVPSKSAQPLRKQADAGAIPSINIFVTAPQGIGTMGRILEALLDQVGPLDRLIVLDGTASGIELDPDALPRVRSIEHRRRAGESAFHLRREIIPLASSDITVLFEEHAIPGPHFMAEIRRLFAADPALAAVKILGRNDISTNPWSWANFLIAFAGCLHPANGMPTAMLSTSAVIRTSALPAGRQALGAWETVILPGLNRNPSRLAYSNEVRIDHVDLCGPKEALVGNFHNQRAIAAVRVAMGHRRGKLAVRAFKDLGLRLHRNIARTLAGREEYRHVVANRGKLVAIGWASALGAIVGAYFGAGSSMQAMH